MRPPGKGELRRELIIPAEVFSREDLRQRRNDVFNRGVRSKLVFFSEDDTRHAHYKLTLIGPAHEIDAATLMFSFFDSSPFLGPRR